MSGLISTFEALLVALIAVLPGTLYTVALAHCGATWAWPKGDAASQVIQFLGVSAAFQALFAPLTYWAYRELIAEKALVEGRVSLWWWFALLAYVALPYAWGIATGRSRNLKPDAGWLKRWWKKLVSVYTAETPEPRAWDRLLSNPEAVGWVRIQLANGEWKAGPWRKPSYASGYGEEPDFYLADQVKVDAAGKFIIGLDNKPVPTGAGLLIRWSEIRYLELLSWIQQRGT